MRSSVNFISAIAVVFVLHAGLCPALCFARSTEPTPSHLEGAGALEKAPCHATSNTPSRGDETREDCDMNCSRFESVALAAFAPRVGLDAPTAAFSTVLLRLLPRTDVTSFKPYELALLPPPRNLLLVKNSFLI